MRSEPLALLGRQRAFQRLAHRRDPRVPRALEEHLPWPRLARPHVRVQLEVDREEAGALGKLHEVALVEVEHRIVGRLDLLVDAVDLSRELEHAVAGIAPEALALLVHRETVDGLEQRRPSA